MLTLGAYKAKAILEGALSLLPGGLGLFRTGTRGSDSARYCYAVWMRHLIRTAQWRTGLFAGSVVELGPGDSLGTGLAALLSGAENYIAIDVVRHADVDRNLAVLDELVRLFAEREPVPGPDEFPEIKPTLADYSFPNVLLPPERVAVLLAPARIKTIAAALRNKVTNNPLVRYVEPAAASCIVPGSISMVFSQAVLEHVDSLPAVYAACCAWLSENGIMSHQIDFKSHGTAREWNGHWVYPDFVWHLLRGRRPYLLNRLPCSHHLETLADTGFEIMEIDRMRWPSRLRQNQLARRFRAISDDDLTTSGAFIVAHKPSGCSYKYVCPRDKVVVGLEADGALDN